MDGIHGISSWRWIFILEGILSTCVACFAFFIVPNFPAESTFLNPEEKEFLLRRLEAERGKEKTSIKDIQWLPIFLDWKVWLNILVYFGADMSAASTAGFSPTILTQLGWTANEANVHNIPIWIVGATCSLTFSIIAGKTGRRFPFIMFGWACCLCGWSIQLAQVNPPAVRYFGLFLFAAGAFIQMPLLVSWLNVNMTGRTAKAVAVALQVGFGNSCNFVSSNVFITAESPKYRTAFSTGVGLTVMGGMAACANAALLWNENRKADKRESEGLSDEVFNMPDGTRFRYTI
jgi:cyanate permease